jgi:hypothetical protein
MGQNDGGIKRGDRADTGDNEAKPTELDGGDDAASVGHTTGDSSALAESMGENAGSFSVEEDDLTIHSADDPNLGLTRTPDHPDGDWAANTGPSRVP